MTCRCSSSAPDQALVELGWLDEEFYIDVVLHRIRHDVVRAQHEMRSASLPELTIDRLAHGM